MENKEIVKAVVDGKVYDVESGCKISDLISADKPCGGHGKCGKCKVKARGNTEEPGFTSLRNCATIFVKIRR